MKSTYSFSRRAPDNVAHEVATVLSGKSWFEFKALFDVVHANLKARNAANGGEEMLRLRAYEKLQNLVSAGIVEKRGKEYRGIATALAGFFEAAAEQATGFTPKKNRRTPATALPVAA
jgi:hypothetical protein